MPGVTPVLIALAAGAVVGLSPAFDWTHPYLRIVGDLFLLGLKMIVPPLIFFSMVTGVAGLGGLKKVRRVAVVTGIYFLGSMSLAVALGLFLVNAIRPGAGASLGAAADVPAAARRFEAAGPLDFVRDQLAAALVNPFRALADNDVMAIIVFALLLGSALASLGSRGQRVLDACGTVNDAVLKIALRFIRLAPYGAFALLALALNRGGVEALQALGKYSFTVLLGLGLHATITMPILLAVFARVNPLRFYAAMRPAAAVAFATASSNATLPVTLACVRDFLKIPPRIASFVLPLGATANMNGTALYEAVAAMFIAQAYGIELSAGAQVMVFVTATVAAIGAAGIPQAGLVTMAVVLKAVGLPLEGIGLILAVDKVLDMVRTTVNVLDDGVGCCIVTRHAGSPARS